MRTTTLSPLVRLSESCVRQGHGRESKWWNRPMFSVSREQQRAEGAVWVWATLLFFGGWGDLLTALKTQLQNSEFPSKTQG